MDRHSDLSPRELSRLIGSIYDCALDPSLWDDALNAIKAVMNCDNAVLHLNDVVNGRILVSKVVGMEPYWIERVLGHSAEINRSLSQSLASWPSLDEPHIVSRHVPREEFETSPYIQDCWPAQGIVDVMTYYLMHTPTRFSGLALGRHKRYGLIGERELEIGALLLPHVRRAVTISNVLDAAVIGRARMAETLDALRCAVILTDPRGTILHANHAAESILAREDLVTRNRDALAAKVPAAAAELRDAIKYAAEDAVAIGKTGLQIRLSEADMPSVFAHVLPMSGSELRAGLQPTAAAAIFISAPDGGLDGAEVMAATYALTPAETRVLVQLLEGKTLAETADALCIAMTTARSHLNHIFSKTGVTRQADLVRLSMGHVPPLRSSRHS
jgi:DNA-binding CsgD family transcriptional regulator/PAS domain-containing protein